MPYIENQYYSLHSFHKDASGMDQGKPSSHENDMRSDSNLTKIADFWPWFNVSNNVQMIWSTSCHVIEERKI